MRQGVRPDRDTPVEAVTRQLVAVLAEQRDSNLPSTSVGVQHEPVSLQQDGFGGESALPIIRIHGDKAVDFEDRQSDCAGLRLRAVVARSPAVINPKLIAYTDRRIRGALIVAVVPTILRAGGDYGLAIADAMPHPPVPAAYKLDVHRAGRLGVVHRQPAEHHALIAPRV